MPRRTSIALALAAAACAGPSPGPGEVPSTELPAAAALEPAQPGAPTIAPAPTGAQPTRQGEPAPALPSGEGSGAAPRLDPPEAIDPKAAASRAEQSLQQSIVAAVEAGDYARARALLDDLLTVPLIAEARVLIEHARPDDALHVTERAIALAPGEPRALLLHGEATLQVGVLRQDPATIERALSAFVQSGTTPTALFGASRASRALGRTTEALRYAREGWVGLAAQSAAQAEPLSGVESPARTLAEAAWSAWIEARATQDEARAAAFEEAELALGRITQQETAELWGWTCLAELYRDQGRLADEQRTLERAIGVHAHEPRLFDALARNFAERGDAQLALECFARLQRERPQSPLPWWHAGRVRFDSALAALDTASIGALQTAEREFAACRARGGVATSAAADARTPIQLEALCRTAVGWCQLRAGNVESALTQFRSTEQLFTGALQTALPGRLESGVTGLAAAAETCARRKDLVGAGAIYHELHVYQPHELEWARQTGALHRDEGERLKLVGDDCLRAAQGKITDPRRLDALRRSVGLDDVPLDDPTRLRAGLREKGERRLERAAYAFETSYAAYRDATRLAPRDLRVLDDCAYVALYDLGKYLDEAERLLQSAVALGAEQVADPALSDEQRDLLREAWGDAHQHLGKLYLEHRRDPAGARAWFQKSLEIGPHPRPEVSESYLPRCEQLLRSK